MDGAEGASQAPRHGTTLNKYPSSSSSSSTADWSDSRSRDSPTWSERLREALALHPWRLISCGSSPAAQPSMAITI
eukprot:scaffold227802_cov30-Tisochrysis_lutea.AAC.2